MALKCAKPQCYQHRGSTSQTIVIGGNDSMSNNNSIQLTAERLREVLAYDAETGVFTWIKSPTPVVKEGTVAGSFHGTKYLRIMIGGRQYLAHRLAWLYVNGRWPVNQIDHIDGNKTNNRIENLRDVSATFNEQNKIAAKIDSKSGLIGASPYRNRWRAQIKINKKIKYLGLFDTAEKAHQAYLAEKEKSHPGWLLGRKRRS